MKLKIIVRRSLCRGRPSTGSRGDPRTRGPGTFALAGRPPTFGIRPYYNWNPESGIWNSPFLIPQYPFPRDWPSYTCSVRQNIEKDRDNDRWKTILAPAGKQQTGRIMPVWEFLNEWIRSFLTVAKKRFSEENRIEHRYEWGMPAGVKRPAGQLKVKN